MLSSVLVGCSSERPPDLCKKTGEVRMVLVPRAVAIGPSIPVGGSLRYVNEYKYRCPDGREHWRRF